MSTIKIAIDGPAGAGKSTISKMIAKDLGFTYIDTGAMYRTVALKAINKNLNTKNSEQVNTILNDIDIKLKYDNYGLKVFLDNEDVTKSIRTPEVSLGASNVAVIPEVRLKLVELQRELANEDNVIMDGRDIGTYVLPDANIKIFLTASVEDRATRRYNELIEKNIECNFEEIKKDIEYRDKNDSTRKFAPLKKADDADIIDTSGNDFEDSYKLLLNYINNKLKNIKK